METISYQECVDFYLEKMHKGLSKNDKERIKKLKKVISDEKLNADYDEFRYTNKDLTLEDYLKSLKSCKSNINQALGYIEVIKSVRKMERLDKDRAMMNKVLSLFKKKKK